MQQQYMPLDAIQIELARLGREGLEKLGADATPYRVMPPPLPLPRPGRPPPARAEPLRRWELAPGIELLADERAAVSDGLVDEIVAIIERHGAAGGRDR